TWTDTPWGSRLVRGEVLPPPRPGRDARTEFNPGCRTGATEHRPRIPPPDRFEPPRRSRPDPDGSWFENQFEHGFEVSRRNRSTQVFRTRSPVRVIRSAGSLTRGFPPTPAPERLDPHRITRKPELPSTLRQVTAAPSPRCDRVVEL